MPSSRTTRPSAFDTPFCASDEHVAVLELRSRSATSAARSSSVADLRQAAHGDELEIIRRPVMRMPACAL